MTIQDLFALAQQRYAAAYKLPNGAEIQPYVKMGPQGFGIRVQCINPVDPMQGCGNDAVFGAFEFEIQQLNKPEDGLRLIEKRVAEAEGRLSIFLLEHKVKLKGVVQPVVETPKPKVKRGRKKKEAVAA